MRHHDYSQRPPERWPSPSSTTGMPSAATGGFVRSTPGGGVRAIPQCGQIPSGTPGGTPPPQPQEPTSGGGGGGGSTTSGGGGGGASPQQPQGGGGGGGGGQPSEQTPHTPGGGGTPPSQQSPGGGGGTPSQQAPAGAPPTPPPGAPTGTDPSPSQQDAQGTTESGGDSHKPHRVKDGECLSSIAKKHGMHWETIWNDSKNQELKNKRQDPNVLFPGDVVQIKNREAKQEPCAAEQLHRFRLLGQPAMFRLRVLNEDEPRANEKYTLKIGDQEYEGTTDPEGKLEHPCPNDAKKAVLTIGNEPDAQDTYEMALGGVDPVQEVRGAQERLFNLGFDPGPIDGKLGPKTEAALRAFQKKHELEETGMLDEATGTKLVEEHGC